MNALSRRHLPATIRSSFAILVIAALLWPIGYALWISFSPGNVLSPPTTDWSLRWYREFFARPQWTLALGNSLFVATIAAMLSILIGIPAAMGYLKLKSRGAKFVEAVLLLPLFVPALVLGLALLPVMRLIGLWGAPFSIAIAHSLWGIPLVFLATRSALVAADPAIEHAARGLGANPQQVFFLITLPTIRPAILTGAVMAFVVSFNELIMALFLGTPATETLPKVIWPNLRYTLSPIVAAASGISMAVTVLLLAAGWIASRTLTRLTKQNR